jgi:hypothetical protein
MHLLELLGLEAHCPPPKRTDWNAQESVVKI